MKAGSAEPGSLCFVSDDEPGIERRGRTRFHYVDQASGASIRDPELKARIDALAIPPAWTDVWICADPSGHIQATGRDAKGRKQYRYHVAYRQRRERHKFRVLPEFGEALGELRARIDADLRTPTLGRDRVVAAVVSLLERTYIRVGNPGYASANKTFGLTTLRERHVHVDGSELRLRFVGKNSKQFDVTCCDARLARVVRRCRDLPGQLIFQYVGDDGDPCPVTSTDVNDYLREVTGVDATAKTFRTWGATLLAAQLLVDLDAPSSARAAAQAINATLAPVAAQLGNTIAVCRASYVHPKVLRRFEDGSLTRVWDAGPSRKAKGLEADERRLLHVLREPL